MAIVKSKNAPENRAFWDHVERVAKYVRDNPEIYAHNRVHQVTIDVQPQPRPTKKQ